MAWVTHAGQTGQRGTSPLGDMECHDALPWHGLPTPARLANVARRLSEKWNARASVCRQFAAFAGQPLSRQRGHRVVDDPLLQMFVGAFGPFVLRTAGLTSYLRFCMEGTDNGAEA